MRGKREGGREGGRERDRQTERETETERERVGVYMCIVTQHRGNRKLTNEG